jgi:PmbA protein
MDAALTRIAELAIEHALQQGAREAAVSLYRSRFVELRRRDGRVETLQSSQSRGLSISLYVDGRYSGNATSLLREAEVRSFIDETLAMTRLLAPDEHRALPDPALYGPEPVELDLLDPGYDQRDMDWRAERVRAAEEAARAASEVVISASAGVTTQTSEGLQLHSNGFRGERRTSSYHLGATVTARDAEGRRPEDHYWVSARHAGDLPEPEGIGKEAARRALARLGGRKVESRRMTMLVENRAAARLVGALLEPLTGGALQQQRSCFAGAEGKSIGSPRLTLIDEPFLPRGLGSRTFDEEGLRPRRRSLIDGGTLNEYLIDVYYGRKLGRAPTGGSVGNLLLPPGSDSLDQLVAGVDRGVLVTGFLGGNSNAATGDFSFGVMGHLIEGGQLRHPVSEMNVTGSHLGLWNQLRAVGGDPYPWSSWRMPSLLFDDVQFSGS